MQMNQAALNRRDFLRVGVRAAAAVAPVSALLAACAADPDQAVPATGADLDARYREALRQAEMAGAPRELRLVAEVGEVEVGPLGVYRTWLYNGQYPGPEIRLRDGERLRATLVNRLADETTIHWHGLPVPNAMDGVPGVTQRAVRPGESFVYDFVAQPSGSYLYHSHVGLQLDRALLGALVVEERTPHVAYDREYTLVLDDYLPGEPQPMPGGGRRRRGMMGGGMMGGMGNRGGRGGMGGGMGAMQMNDTPAYSAHLINGRPPQAPSVFEVRRGERIRLRLVNPASTTTYRVAIAGHRLQVTHTDGRPVEPLAVDSLVIGMGERYDVLVEANNPGAWTIAAESVVAGGPPMARAVLRYTDASATTPAAGEIPTGLRGGQVLELTQLRSVELPPAAGRPDRVYDLTLSGGMMSSQWTIDGQAYPDADPLPIRSGERVRVQMTNMSPAIHPMHLHGHFFRVANVLKETVLVPPHMGRVAFEFTADNPGDWFFHCHQLYHMESGMARVFPYVP